MVRQNYPTQTKHPSHRFVDHCDATLLLPRHLKLKCILLKRPGRPPSSPQLANGIGSRCTRLQCRLGGTQESVLVASDPNVGQARFRLSTLRDQPIRQQRGNERHHELGEALVWKDISDRVTEDLRDFIEQLVVLRFGCLALDARPGH